MDVFSALAEPTRRDIVELLAARGQLSASQIYRNFNTSPPAISQHLKVLRDAKLINVEKDAQRRLYKINPQKIGELDIWTKKMQKLWSKRFRSLDELLTGEKTMSHTKYSAGERRKAGAYGRH